MVLIGLPMIHAQDWRVAMPILLVLPVASGVAAGIWATLRERNGWWVMWGGFSGMLAVALAAAVGEWAFGAMNATDSQWHKPVLVFAGAMVASAVLTIGEVLLVSALCRKWNGLLKKEAGKAVAASSTKGETQLESVKCIAVDWSGSTDEKL